MSAKLIELLRVLPRYVYSFGGYSNNFTGCHSCPQELPLKLMKKLTNLTPLFILSCILLEGYQWHIILFPTLSAHARR